MPNLLIAVVHDKKFVLRLQTLNTLISKLVSGFKVEIIDRYNQDDITTDDINATIKLESPKSETYFDGMVKHLHVKQVSQALKHKAALEMFIAQDVFDTMLVIEDDVLCSENITTELEHAIETLNGSPDIDMLFLGCPTPKVMVENHLSVAPILQYFKLLPTVDSYLIKKSKAVELLACLLPIRYTIGIQYSFLASQQKIKAYMSSPNIFVNGSKYGVYVSSVDPNNKLFMNNDFNKLAALNSKPEPLTTSEVDEVKKMSVTVQLREHPDFQYQFAVFYMNQKLYKEAKEHFDVAYKFYNENDCIINNNSDFLINYTRIFKYLQPDRDAINESLDI
jgi:GR25 family glycosyltransferase involved in LPS biosynthesis